ncbi:hypothetical protein STEG23_000346 [Scotinomys teguina]
MIVWDARVKGDLSVPALERSSTYSLGQLALHLAPGEDLQPRDNRGTAEYPSQLQGKRLASAFGTCIKSLFSFQRRNGKGQSISARTLDPDTAFSSPGLNGIMAPGDSAGHSDQDVAGGSMALIYSHGCNPDMEHLCGLWSMDMNTDPGYGRTMGPEIVLSSNPGQNVTMTPGSCLWQQTPQTPTWPEVVAHTTSPCMAPSSYRSHRFQQSPPPPAIPEPRPRPVFLVSGGQLAIHDSLLLITLTPPDPPPSPAHKPFCLSLSSTSPPCTLTTMVP